MRHILILFISWFFLSPLIHADPVCEEITYLNKEIEYKEPSEGKLPFVFDRKYSFFLDIPEYLYSPTYDDSSVFFYYGRDKGFVFSHVYGEVLYDFKKVFSIIPQDDFYDESRDIAVEMLKSFLCGHEVVLYHNNNGNSDQYITLLYSQTIRDKEDDYIVLIFPKSKKPVDVITHIGFGGYSLDEVESILSSIAYKEID